MALLRSVLVTTALVLTGCPDGPSSAAMETEAGTSTGLEGEAEKAAVSAKIKKVIFVRAPKKNAFRKRRLRISLNPRAHVNNFKAWLRGTL